jgi:hypothetical protein
MITKIHAETTSITAMVASAAVRSNPSLQVRHG